LTPGVPEAATVVPDADMPVKFAEAMVAPFACPARTAAAVRRKRRRVDFGFMVRVMVGGFGKVGDFLATHCLRHSSPHDKFILKSN
jgi:hypothetical protein